MMRWWYLLLGFVRKHMGAFMIATLVAWLVIILASALVQTLNAPAENNSSSTTPKETTAQASPTKWEKFAANSDDNVSNIEKITVTPILAYLTLAGTVLGIYVLYKVIS